MQQEKEERRRRLEVRRTEEGQYAGVAVDVEQRGVRTAGDGVLDLIAVLAQREVGRAAGRGVQFRHALERPAASA